MSESLMGMDGGMEERAGSRWNKGRKDSSTAR